MRPDSNSRWEKLDMLDLHLKDDLLGAADAALHYPGQLARKMVPTSMSERLGGTELVDSGFLRDLLQFVERSPVSFGDTSELQNRKMGGMGASCTMGGLPSSNNNNNNCGGGEAGMLDCFDQHIFAGTLGASLRNEAGAAGPSLTADDAAFIEREGQASGGSIFSFSTSPSSSLALLSDRLVLFSHYSEPPAAFSRTADALTEFDGGIGECRVASSTVSPVTAAVPPFNSFVGKSLDDFGSVATQLDPPRYTGGSVSQESIATERHGTLAEWGGFASEDKTPREGSVLISESGGGPLFETDLFREKSSPSKVSCYEAIDVLVSARETTDNKEWEGPDPPEQLEGLTNVLLGSLLEGERKTPPIVSENMSIASSPGRPVSKSPPVYSSSAAAAAGTTKQQVLEAMNALLQKQLVRQGDPMRCSRDRHSGSTQRPAQQTRPLSRPEARGGGFSGIGSHPTPTRQEDSFSSAAAHSWRSSGDGLQEGSPLSQCVRREAVGGCDAASFATFNGAATLSSNSVEVFKASLTGHGLPSPVFRRPTTSAPLLVRPPSARVAPQCSASSESVEESSLLGHAPPCVLGAHRQQLRAINDDDDDDVGDQEGEGRFLYPGSLRDCRTPDRDLYHYGGEQEVAEIYGSSSGGDFPAAPAPAPPYTTESASGPEMVGYCQPELRQFMCSSIGDDVKEVVYTGGCTVPHQYFTSDRSAPLRNSGSHSIDARRGLPVHREEDFLLQLAEANVTAPKTLTVPQSYLERLQSLRTTNAKLPRESSEKAQQKRVLSRSFSGNPDLMNASLAGFTKHFSDPFVGSQSPPFSHSQESLGQAKGGNMSLTNVYGASVNQQLVDGPPLLLDRRGLSSENFPVLAAHSGFDLEGSSLHSLRTSRKAGSAGNVALQERVQLNVRPIVEDVALDLTSAAGSAEALGSPRKPSFGSAVEDVRGRVASLARVQSGSRYLQRLLARTHEKQEGIVDVILEEVKADVTALMVDPYGNYLCQQLFQVCSSEKRKEILQVLAPNAVSIVKDRRGTHSVQALISLMVTREEQEILIAALKDHVLDLATHRNGTHVIQRLLQRLDESLTDWIFEPIIESLKMVAQNAHGLCVVKRCVSATAEHKPAIQQAILSKLEENAYEFMKSPFGNYAIQHAIDTWGPLRCEKLISAVITRLIPLSTHKFSSNVVEKCIEVASKTQFAEIVSKLAEPEKMSALMHSSYGNFVVQKALSRASDRQSTMLKAAINTNLPGLEQKRLRGKWEKVLGAAHS